MAKGLHDGPLAVLTVASLNRTTLSVLEFGLDLADGFGRCNLVAVWVVGRISYQTISPFQFETLAILPDLVSCLQLVSDSAVLELPRHHHGTRWRDRRRAEAMDKLSEDGRGVYALLRADFTADLDQRFKEHGENLLQAVDKLIQANTTTLDGLLSARVDGVRDEFALELEQIRGEWQKDPPGRVETSSSRLAGSGRGTASDSLGIDQEHRGKAHNTYVPPPVRGARDSNFPARFPPGRDSSSPDTADAFSFGVRADLPRFDGANPRLWQSRCEDQFRL